MQVLDLNTAEGCAEYVKTFTDEQLTALREAPTTPARFLLQCCADAEAILREAGVR